MELGTVDEAEVATGCLFQSGYASPYIAHQFVAEITTMGIAVALSYSYDLGSFHLICPPIKLTLRCKTIIPHNIQIK